MITGASQADAAVLVVAVNDGIMPQTQEHVFLSRTLGIQQLAVLINKMDTVNYSQEKFDAIKAEVEKLIRTVGFKVEKQDLSLLQHLMGTTLLLNLTRHRGIQDQHF